MNTTPLNPFAAIAPKDDAPQHGPRPLPLFLQILWQETTDDPALRLKAFQGLRRYQAAKRPSLPPEMPVAAQIGATRLLRYRRAKKRRAGKAPVVFIPSLINPPQVLDLDGDVSLLRHLAGRGYDVYLVDWGMPREADAMLDLKGHVTRRLFPLMRRFRTAPILVGYCLGGTLALALAAIRDTRAVATIAAPWRFAGFEPESRARIADLWKNSGPVCEALGYVPMEVLQSGFWSLDARRTIAKYARFADAEEGSAAAHAFIRLEDWANAGAPLTYAAGKELFERLYGADDPGGGEWRISGRTIDPAALDCPTWAVLSSTDRIVPAATAPSADESRTLDLGHVGMVVGSRAKRELWEPLTAWLKAQGA